MNSLLTKLFIVIFFAAFLVCCNKNNSSNNNVIGTIAAINSTNATQNGIINAGVAANSVNVTIPYSGGNGGNYSGQSVTSSVVTGLTATLAAGRFSSGTGSIILSITGTPISSGIASFTMSVGGQTFTFNVIIQYSNGSNVTFTYMGSTVTYGSVLGQSGKYWLDRNLGASRVATSSTDIESYGHLFQWGRGSDGHQLRLSVQTSNLSSNDVVSNNSFITTCTAPNDWRTPQNSNLWQIANGDINRVCPSGWRLPTIQELMDERAFWPVSNFSGAFASPLKLPMAGGRNFCSGEIGYLGSDARYWSSSVRGTDSKYLSIGQGGSDSLNGRRANGFSVRCIKE
jgi:hypothetical protein